MIGDQGNLSHLRVSHTWWMDYLSDLRVVLHWEIVLCPEPDFCTFLCISIALLVFDPVTLWPIFSRHCPWYRPFSGHRIDSSCTIQWVLSSSNAVVRPLVTQIIWTHDDYCFFHIERRSFHTCTIIPNFPRCYSEELCVIYLVFCFLNLTETPAFSPNHQSSA